MIDEKIEECCNEFIATARTNLERDGQVYPVAFVFANDTFEVILMLWEGDDEKEMAAKLLQLQSKRPDVEAIFTVLESWFIMKPVDHQHSESDIPPSMSINRKECVMFQLSTRSGNKVAMAEITYPSEGVKSFGEVVLEEHKSEGRFMINLQRGDAHVQATRRSSYD